MKRARPKPSPEYFLHPNLGSCTIVSALITEWIIHLAPQNYIPSYQSRSLAGFGAITRILETNRIKTLPTALDQRRTRYEPFEKWDKYLKSSLKHGCLKDETKDWRLFGLGLKHPITVKNNIGNAVHNRSVNTPSWW